MALVMVAGCAGTPEIGGAPSVAPSPDRPWTPPEAVRKALAPADTAPSVSLPRTLVPRLARLTMGDILDVGLRNNPETRVAWANAQTAAAAYGSAQGQRLPTIDADISALRVKTAATQGRTSVEQSVLAPSVSLSYLLFDFGGRGGRISAARDQSIAASFTHNAVLQNVVLGIQVAYFQYLGNRALLDAQETTLKEAEANLEAAEERRRVGVATIADVLQARTAASQARLAAQTTEGAVQTARGALALALGLPANLAFDVDSAAEAAPVAMVADSVDAIIAGALRARPDLAASEARAAAEVAGIGEARSALLPSLGFTATGGRTYASTIPNGASSYTVGLGVTVPLFSGFSRQYDVRAQRFAADAAAAQTRSVRQQVVYQVFSSYYALQTASRRVRTAEDLHASATQSSEVAQARYRAGVGTLLDLLAAQTALADARAQQVSARVEWNVSLAQLAHDAGVLDPSGRQTFRLASDTTASHSPESPQK